MIVVLNFCNHDRDQALRLLQWIGELGGVKGHDVLLQFSQGVRRAEQHVELIEEATKHFAAVSTNVPCTEDERGWPHSPNHGWLAALTLIREKVMKPWLWLEPDAAPISPLWLNKIEAEYIAVNPAVEPKDKNPPKVKPFMGALVNGSNRRLSGVAVYPPRVVSFLTQRRLPDLHVRNEAFDSYFAPEFTPFAHFTNLIQQVHLVSRDPEIAPTFPTQESLSLLNPEAVLFHRCKDVTLIDRLRERSDTKRIVVSEHLIAHKGLFEHSPENQQRFADMQAEIDLLRLKLSGSNANGVIPPKTNDSPGAKPEKHSSRSASRRRVKKKRTPEQQAVIDARMAKIREAKAAKAVATA